MRIAMLVVSFSLVASVALAVDPYGWDPASVDIGGQHILKFRVAAGGMTPAQRRAIFEFRLTKALTHTEYLKPVNMTYRKCPAGIAVYANGIYLLSVTPADAKANKSTPRSLAQSWGKRIKRTFEIVGPARQLPHEAAAHPEAPISMD
ncbi:hypothetical protein LLH23_09910 [bacterium]|nr:hypothetical protein [bacterium]